MQILKLLPLMVLLISCSKPSEPEFSFAGLWLGTWKPLGTSAYGMLEIRVHEDGSAEGHGDITYYINPDVRYWESVRLNLVIDGYGYISGTGSWSKDGPSAQIGEVTGRFPPETAYGYFQVNTNMSQQPKTISWSANKIRLQ